MKVYLAGPMCGCDARETFDWRDEFASAFDDIDEVKILDPTVGLEYIYSQDKKLDVCNDHHGVTNKEVFQKDIFMIDNSDLLLVNLFHMNLMSTGCYFEMGYAFAKGIPIVVVNAGAKRDHPFIDIPALNLDTMEEAIEYIKSLAWS